MIISLIIIKDIIIHNLCFNNNILLQYTNFSISTRIITLKLNKVFIINY